MYKPYNDYKITISHEVWREFQKRHPDFKELGFDYWSIREILSSFGEIVEDAILDTTDGFQFPHKMGRLQIIGAKYRETEKQKHRKHKLVRTDNIYYKLAWNIKFERFRLKMLLCYRFTSARLFRDKLISRIKEDKFFHWIKYEDQVDFFKRKAVNPKKIKETTDLIKSLNH